MALFGVIGFVAATAVMFVYALSVWELLSAQSRCDCSFERFDTSPGVIARTLTVLALTMARSLAEVHAAHCLLSPDPRARRRRISVYIAVAAIHGVVAPLWIEAFAVPFVVLAGWSLVVVILLTRGWGTALPRAYVRHGTAIHSSECGGASRSWRSRPS
jgi:hypothetical protein